MSVAVQKQDVRLKVSIPVEPGEEERFKNFLRASGRKAGPYLRVLILREVERAERIAAGRTQMDLEELEARR